VAGHADSKERKSKNSSRKPEQQVEAATATESPEAAVAVEDSPLHRAAKAGDAEQVQAHTRRGVYCGSQGQPPQLCQTVAFP
jgi:hypothetical protein